MPPESIIRSRQNSIYKQIRSRLRRDRRHQERAFLVEGPRFVADAQRFGAVPMLGVFRVLCRISRNFHRWRQSARIFDDELFASISDTVTPQGLIGVFPFPIFRSPRRHSVDPGRRWHSGSGESRHAHSIGCRVGRHRSRCVDGHRRSLVAQGGASRSVGSLSRVDRIDFRSRPGTNRAIGRTRGWRGRHWNSILRSDRSHWPYCAHCGRGRQRNV